MKTLLVLISLCISSLISLTEEITFSRLDNSVIKGYLTIPKAQKSYPLIVFIQGSEEVSVLANHEKLSKKLLDNTFALLSIEKRGLNTSRFGYFNCLKSRVADYKTLFQKLEKGAISNWNRKLILMGASEGGKVLPILANAFEDQISGGILFECGGGIPFQKELKYQLETRINQLNFFRRASYTIRSFLKKEGYERQIKKIQLNPTVLRKFHSKTYKWWASFLNYDPLPDLLKLSIPLYMIHGVDDDYVPIESADQIARAFKELGKTNLTFKRIEGLGHESHDKLYPPLIEWMKAVTKF